MKRALSIAVLAALLPTQAFAEPKHTPADELGTPLPPGGRVAPAPPLLHQRDVKPGLLPAAERDTVSDLGLVALDDGSFAFADPGARFTALVRLDGSVLFADRWRAWSVKNKQRGRGSSLPPEGARALNPFVGVRLSGPLEWSLRATRVDPYATAKTGFLVRTEAFRRSLAIGFAKHRIEVELRALPRQLLELWRDGKRSAANKRALLFQRWDDCEDVVHEDDHDPAVASATGEIDAARVAAAARARSMIESFVRRHAPAGSRNAYAKDELRRLNAKRKSDTAFAPYGE
jgi:hypothetical protein